MSNHMDAKVFRSADELIVGGVGNETGGAVSETNGGAPKGLIIKLAEIMAVVERVPKRGHNDYHNYDYATEADIAATIRMELAGRHIMLIPGIVSCQRDPVGEKGSVLTTIAMTFTFLDGETGEELKRGWMGAGTDKEDKGLYKAMTGGEKYFLLKTFLLPTGDDPERPDREDDKRETSGGSQERQTERRRASSARGPYADREEARTTPEPAARLSDWLRLQERMKRWPPEIAAIIPTDEALFLMPEAEAEANRDLYMTGIRDMAIRRNLSANEKGDLAEMFLGRRNASTAGANIYVLRALWKLLMDPEQL